MTTFNEFDHPRSTTGKFAEKSFTAAAVTLERPVDHGVNTDNHGIFDIARAYDGQRAVIRLAGEESHYSYPGTFISDTDGASAIIQLDDMTDPTVLIQRPDGSWRTEDGLNARAFTEHEKRVLPIAELSDGPSRSLRKGETFDPSPWQFDEVEYAANPRLAGKRFRTMSPHVPHYNAPKWKPRDAGLSAVQRDALTTADESGHGKVYTVQGNRTGFGLIGDDAYCFNQETIDALVKKGLLEEDTDGDSTTVNWAGKARLYRLTRPEK